MFLHALVVAQLFLVLGNILGLTMVYLFPERHHICLYVLVITIETMINNCV